MSSLNELSGVLRANGIRTVAAGVKLRGEPLTIENIGAECAKILGSTFGSMDPDEHAALMAELEPPEAENGEPRHAAASLAAPAATDGNESGHTPTTPTAEISHGEALTAVREADQRAHDARAVLQDAEKAARLAKVRLETATVEFTTGIVGGYSREQLQRDYIASEQARKHAGIEARREPSHGPSVFDLSRSGGSGRAGSPFAIKRRPVFDVATGRYVRPYGEAGGFNRDPARGPIAKLPSDAA